MKKLFYILALFLIISSCKKPEQDDLSITVYIPNAFRPGSTVDCPGGDIDCNRSFKVVTDYSRVQQGEIRIYDQQQQQQKVVFQTTNYRVGWNGKVLNMGADCPQGNYHYLIKVTESPSGKSKVFEGKVLLLR